MDFVVIAFAAIFFTLILSFFKGISRDTCLKDFSSFPVVIVRKEGSFAGLMQVKSSGIELELTESDQGHSGYLLYADEYPSLEAIVRYHHHLSDPQKKSRYSAMKAIYHPSVVSKINRTLSSVMKLARDGFLEIIHLIAGQAKSLSRWGTIFARQEGKTKEIGTELLNVLGTAYDALLERHLGHWVVVEVHTSSSPLLVTGILKDYTAQFIELMDVTYPLGESLEGQKADLILLRGSAIPRYVRKRSVNSFTS